MSKSQLLYERYGSRIEHDDDGSFHFVETLMPTGPTTWLALSRSFSGIYETEQGLTDETGIAARQI
jgi:hypothetical protein